MLGCEENLDHQDSRAYHNRTVGDVKVGPDVLADIELEEVDNVSVEYAVPQIPKRSAEDQRQSKRGAIESLRVSP